MRITSLHRGGLAASHFAASLHLTASSLASVILLAIVHGKDHEKTHHSFSDRVSLTRYQVQQAWAGWTDAGNKLKTSRLSA
ncbi:hypothetical protein [Undibacterium hunanense]|uniref:hypothetical protein n=1 Tax=Undibacterium hunanense TaxID=2762292 RepID=UPI00164A1F7C|nr:hypothetical protein [Undibacterium hunanense]